MSMSGSVTACADGNQILFDIIPEAAARAKVVNLKILSRAAVLAAPSVACEHDSEEPAVGLGFKP